MSRINLHSQDLIKQRFEMKYLVSEFETQQIIDFMAPYMQADPMGKEYPVTSLYLDNDDMAMFWSSEMGEKNRYKLRLRSYSGFDGAPIFAEVKRRVDRVILKTRVPIRREMISALLNDSAPSHVIVDHRDNEQHIRDLEYFREIQSSLGASPRVTVKYMREAFMCLDDEPIRITFDRSLECLPTTEYTPRIWDRDNFWIAMNHIPTVMEVKFTDAYPSWIPRMIERFGLQRRSLAKYVECVRTLKREQYPLHQPEEQYT